VKANAPTTPSNFTGRIAYRTTFPAALLNGYPIDDFTKWWGEDRHIVIYFIKPDRSEVYFVTSQLEPGFRIESWPEKGDVTVLLGDSCRPMTPYMAEKTDTYWIYAYNAWTAPLAA
jgi:hypothetical protein